MVGKGALLLRNAILTHTDSRYENAKKYAAMVVTGLETNSTGGVVAARGTINGSGEDTVATLGASSAAVGDILLISYTDPTGPKTYVRHIDSPNPVPQIITNGSLPDPQFDTVPFTSDLSTNPGSILSNGVVHFLAVEDRWFPEGYTASFRIVGQDWRESGFAPHLGGAQQITLASDFPPGTSLEVRLRGHYAGFSNLSVGLDTRTFVTATDNITPGSCTGITVDLTIPGALKITPIATTDPDHFDHFRYYIATSSGGAGLVTLDGPTGFVYASTPGNRYIAVAPISKSGVVGTRYPAVAGTYDGPYAIVIATPALDTTPPPQWAAPTLAQSTNDSANGGEEHWLTITLNTNANYASTTNPAASVPDYNYSLITLSGTGYAGQQQIVPANNSLRMLVEPVGIISVTVIGVDKLGNKGTASTAATITVTPTGVPGNAPNVTTNSSSEAIIIHWTAATGALRYNLWRATSAAGAGAAIIAPGIDGNLWPDLFTGNGAAGTIYYYKVEGFNLKGTGAISSTWIAGTVGAIDGRNLAALTVTAASLEANLVLASVIRTPDIGFGYVGMIASSGQSRFIAVDHSGVLQMQLIGTGLSFYRDGTNKRMDYASTGITWYQDTGSNVVRATMLGDGLRIYQDNGSTTRISLLNTGLFLWDSAAAQGAALYEVSGKIIFAMPYFVVDQTRAWIDMTHLTGGLQMAFGSGLAYLVPDSSTQFRFDIGSGNLLTFANASTLHHQIIVGAIPTFYFTYPYTQRTATTLANTNGAEAPIAHWETIVDSGGDVLNFRLRAVRGPGTVTTWQDSRIRFETGIDTTNVIGGYIEMGFRNATPFWALGNATAGSQIFWDGANNRITVPVAFAATGSKTFAIPHPDPEKVGWELKHSTVESPTAGDNLYRYVIEILEEEEDRDIYFDLPSYWKFLNRDGQIWVNPIRHRGSAWGEISEGGWSYVVNASVAGKYSVLIMGTRKDKNVTNWDETGEVERLLPLGRIA